MKKLIALLLVLCMLLGICACSNQSEDLAPSSSLKPTGSRNLTGNRKQWRINSRFHIGHMDIGADYARRRRKHNPSNPSGE